MISPVSERDFWNWNLACVCSSALSPKHSPRQNRYRKVITPKYCRDPSTIRSGLWPPSPLHTATNPNYRAESTAATSILMLSLEYVRHQIRLDLFGSLGAHIPKCDRQSNDEKANLLDVLTCVTPCYRLIAAEILVLRAANPNA